jgi:CheY-like chemotaxis protein
MPSLNGLYVLVVDDHSGARDILKVGLQHQGAIVYVAPSAPEAILMLSTVVPDVIITDLTMPPMDGYEFLAELKNSPVWRHIPIIAMTGFAEIHEERKVRAAGFADYILKPVDPGALAAAIVRVI